MKNKTIVVAAALTMAIAATDLSAMDATLSADGSIRFAQADDYAIRPMLFLPGWKGAQSRTLSTKQQLVTMHTLTARDTPTM